MLAHDEKGLRVRTTAESASELARVYMYSSRNVNTSSAAAAASIIRLGRTKSIAEIQVPSSTHSGTIYIRETNMH